jgi:outer membrane usher protein
VGGVAPVLGVRACARSDVGRISVVRVVIVALLVAGLTMAMSLRTAHGQEDIYQKPVSSRLNFTGRTLMLPVPLEFEGRVLGEMPVRLEPDDSVLVASAPLLEKIKEILTPAVYERVRALPTPGGVVATTALKSAGLDVAFDKASMVLKLEVPGAQRPVTDLSMSRARSDIMATYVRPAIYSGYVNMTLGADSSWGANETALISPRLELEAVVRVKGVVLENAFLVEGDVDGFTCPIGAKCVYEHSAGIKRQRTRAVYDMPERAMRLQLGDVVTWGEGFQRAPELLGITVEGAPRKLQPTQNVRPTGRSSFVVDRPSDVEILINGLVVQRLQLRPGSYNVRDLPLVTGGNDVELVIVDDTGQRRSIRFTTFFDAELLAPGKNEWSASAGVASAFRDSERIYFADEPFATGTYRQGLTDRMTAMGNLQADRQVAMGGGGLFTATAWGNFALQGVASASEIGLGAAARVDWDLVEFKGLLHTTYGTRENVRLSGEIRSEDFRTPGDFLIGAEGILFPQYPYWLRLAATHSAMIGNNITATSSLRYQFSDAAACARHAASLFICGDRYGIDLSLSAPLQPNLSGALTFGYSNETLLASRQPISGDDADFRVMLRLNYRADQNTRITAGVDSLTRSATVSAASTYGPELDRWETQVDASGDAREKRAYASAAVNHTAPRYEARAIHTSVTSDLGPGDGGRGGNNGLTIENRTSVRLGTALVYADGRMGFSRPIRGDGFAIVYPHESLKGREISVGTNGDVRARSDSWGPAIVHDLPAYAPTSLPVDVADLPVGYSLGSGIYEVAPPYKAGYALQVGSSYAVTVFGTMLAMDGEPVSLVSGSARAESGDKDRRVQVFTNRVGRFAAEGLAPGRWVIEMDTPGGTTTFVVEVPKGTDGLFKAETLKAVSGPKGEEKPKADEPPKADATGKVDAPEGAKEPEKKAAE